MADAGGIDVLALNGHLGERVRALWEGNLSRLDWERDFLAPFCELCWGVIVVAVMEALYSRRNAVARLLPMVLMAAVLTGCDVAPVMPDSGGRDNGGAGNGEPASDATLCDGQPAMPMTGVSTSADRFITDYERDALARLHNDGWTGKGVHVVIADIFKEDGSPSHGTSVLDFARYYAPSATFHKIGQHATVIPYLQDEGYRYYQEPHLPYVHNKSFDSSHPPLTDELTRVQSGAYWTVHGEHGLQVWAASNANTDVSISGNIADAHPTLVSSGFVYHFGNPDDAQVTGMLHEKSGFIVVGSVDYDQEAEQWILSHSSSRDHYDSGTRTYDYSHSPRAGHAKHAYLVVPDDVDSETFIGTSWAAPRVSGAFALLKQKCSAATAAQLGFVLLRSARDLGEKGVDDIYGYGLLDIENAMAKAETLLATFDDFDSTVQPTTGSADQQ